MRAQKSRAITYIIGTYPRLTTTFIDREIGRVRASGLDLLVVSLRRPDGRFTAADPSLSDGVRYLLPVSPLDLIRSHVWALFTRPGRLLATLVWLPTRPHPSTRARLKTVLHIGEGIAVAHMLRHRPATGHHLHAHFVDRAATVALVVGRLLGLPYSATAHANDIYVDPVLLTEKVRAAAFVATCTGYNEDHLAAVTGAAADEIERIYHGLDLEAFSPPETRPGGTPTILAIGQLKEKKGFRYLIDACALLRDTGRDVRCEIIGEGPCHQELQQRISDHHLEPQVTLAGALPHREVVERLRTASLFVLPAVVAIDGDRDGIPNVILEAMAMELPVVSTLHSGIPEAVIDGETGLLVSPGDAGELAAAMSSLLGDESERIRMGKRGREIVVEAFDVDRNVDRLISRMGG